MSKGWYIVTNTENLTHFINYDLIIDEQGFPNDSYLIDAMQDVPNGYIPCFSEGNLFDAVQKAKQLDSNLSCCFLQLDFAQIANLTTWGDKSEKNGSIAYQMHDDIKNLINKEGINCILLPAPIPFSMIKRILLENGKSKKIVQSIYEEKFSSSDGFFSGNSKHFNELLKQENRGAELFDNQQKIEHQPSDVNINYSKIFSYGGALGLLYYQTKNGIESTDIFKLFSEFLPSYRNDISSNIENKNILKIIEPYSSYLFNDLSTENDISTIYKLLIKKVAITNSYGENCQSILNILKNLDMAENYNSKCHGLSKALEKIVERTNEKDPEAILRLIINDLYKEDVDFKNLAFLLTMFFLRDHVETMLKYYHPDFTETHYSLLAIFFGMSYGIVNIPNKVRRIDDLSTWLSYKMADYAHNIDEDNTVEYKEPSRPLLLYGDIIKTNPTKVCLVHDIYLWIDRNFKKAPVSSLIESRFPFPKKASIEEGSMNVDGLLDLRLIIKIDILENLIQEKVKEDNLFDFKEIIDAYKK